MIGYTTSTREDLYIRCNPRSTTLLLKLDEFTQLLNGSQINYLFCHLFIIPFRFSSLDILGNRSRGRFS